MSEFILYNYFRSSTSYRTRIALNLKDIPYEYRPINLLKGEQHSSEYKALNSLGGVPTLVHQGRVIPDSMAIILYLNDIKPLPAFLPQDPYLKARILQTSEIINSSLHPMGNLRVLQHLEKTQNFSAEQKKDWATHWLHIGLEALDKTLTEFCGDYSFGNEITLTDILLIPQIMTAQRNDVDISQYPTLSRINDNCLKLDSFAKAHPFVQMDTPAELRTSV